MIVTFYSYKGGVGRSMALANVADLLARCGLRILIVDFDLEAPGLEHFFPIDHDEVRGHEGLLDLLLTFKHSMSTAASDPQEREAFRRLERFVATVYPFRDGAGGIDLLPAGRRLTDEQIGRYGEELRRFDWADFYFSWSGELFFDWLRKIFAERYDVVLVDSRTGVTEMGGVCAYQLADAIVVLCAPNRQNVEGTEAMVRHFLSSQVRAVRGDRPLDLLVVPARVDQGDTELRATFRERFQECFGAYAPAALAAHGLTLWDLQIPYEPRYAFDEQVITDPGRVEERMGLAAAYGKLLDGVAFLAPDGSRLATLRPRPIAAAPPSSGSVVETAAPPSAGPVLTQYDPTTRFAAPDVFLSFGRGSESDATTIATRLMQDGFRVATSPRAQDAVPTRAFWELVQGAKAGLVLVGPEGDRSPWRDRELTELLTPAVQRIVVPVLLPGAEYDQIPSLLRHLVAVDLRESTDSGWSQLRVGLLRAMTEDRSATPTTRNPYRGMAPFREADQDIFLGRDAEISAVVERIRADHACSIVGPAGIGKTSLVFAGVVPVLRQGAVEGSDRWPVVAVQAGDRPTLSLAAAMLKPADVPDARPEAVLDDVDGLLASLRGRFGGVLLVVDQLEELFTRTDPVERRSFTRYLTALCRSGHDLVVPILAMRSDFVDVAMSSPDLAGLLTAPIAVGPLDAKEQRAAIEVPARRLGLALEPGLTDRLLTDVADAPGALTLLQFVLDQLWRDQRDGYLTHASYERTGGVAHALAYHADAAIKDLTTGDQQVAKKILLQLVELSEDGDRRRRTLGIVDLAAGPEGESPDAARISAVIEQLIGQRLLATRSVKGQLQVELAHDAIIDAWPRLREWIEDIRGALQARSRLAAAAREWDALDRDSAALLPPERLNKLLPAIGTLPLTDLEREYVAACENHARAKQASRAWSVAGVSAVTAFLASIATALSGAETGFDMITAGQWVIALIAAVVAFGSTAGLTFVVYAVYAVPNGAKGL